MTEPTARPEVVYRWDLDKTYLHTDFSTVRGLVQAAVESAQRRRTIPGMRALLSALWHGHDARLVVVSGSPTFLRRRILALFQLHGIRCDRLVLKDFSGAVRRGRIRSLSSQVPYKLRGHLDTRLWLAARGEDVGEICFGDDAEVDALVYCLYADACAGRVDPARLARILELTGAYPDEIAAILERVAQVPRGDPVRRVFIHLEAGSPPARFGAYRGRVTPSFNALQIALHLTGEALADDRVITEVADELVRDHRVGADGLAGSVEDALRRGLCTRKLAERVVTVLLPATSAYDIGFSGPFAAKVAGRLGEPLRSVTSAADPDPLPYESLFAAEQAFAKAAKLARATAGKIPGLAEFLGSRPEGR